MLHFSTLSELKQFAQSRQKLGLERWMPVVASVNDGMLFFVPGDERYPDVPEMIDIKQPIISLDSTLEEQESLVKCQNLTIMRNGHFESVSTVVSNCGHKQPIRFTG